MTNELPWIEDASGALTSRFVVLTLKRSFYGQEDHNLFDKFIPELPGILNWALDGWDRLYKRGHFVQPGASVELIKQLEDLSSPVSAFLRDECVVRGGATASCGSLYERWRSWCNKNGRDRPGTLQVFSRNVHAAMPWLKSPRQRSDGKRVQSWEGLELKPEALGVDGRR